jgi:hypothetical protein
MVAILIVIPAEAGIQEPMARMPVWNGECLDLSNDSGPWIPAYAGMTAE